MTKRKPTKHEDDILRNIRQPDRYDPKARSIGGPWRMVKCKDGAYVCYEQHMEIIDNLRKNAEINPAQSPHDGIHTCSKGCRKPGCNRTLRDTIEEQDAQIVALNQALLEKAAYLRRLHQERVHDIGMLGEYSAELARLKSEVEELRLENGAFKRTVNEASAHYDNRLADIARLSSEVNRLRASSFVTAVPVEQYERLVKAGDAMVLKVPDMMAGCVRAEEAIWLMNNWNAAKEGKPSA